MFINTKILSLITLLLFSGAIYGAYNYWQSNVPPKQAFLLQGFEQTLEAVDEEIEGKSEEELDYYKKRIDKGSRGSDLLTRIAKIQTSTKALHISLDSMFALNANATQIATKINDYQKQVLTFCPTDAQKELNFTFVNFLNRQLIQQSSNNFTAVAQKQLKVRVNQAQIAAIDKVLNRITLEPIMLHNYFPLVKPNAQQLNIGDTLQLKIHLAARSYLTNYFVSINQKNYQPNADGVVHYKTVCNKVGKHRLKGTLSPPACAACVKKTFSFDLPYTVEACR
jgi:hypothetical protein